MRKYDSIQKVYLVSKYWIHMALIYNKRYNEHEGYIFYNMQVFSYTKPLSILHIFSFFLCSLSSFLFVAEKEIKCPKRWFWPANGIAKHPFAGQITHHLFWFLSEGYLHSQNWIDSSFKLTKDLNKEFFYNLRSKNESVKVFALCQF